MQQPVTLFGETDSQRCTRLRLGISNLNVANRPSAEVDDGAAGGSGGDWTPPRAAGSGDESDGRGVRTSQKRKRRSFACSTSLCFVLF